MINSEFKLRTVGLSKKVFFFFMICPLLLQAQSADKVLLAYKYPSDRYVKYLNITKINQEMDANGQAMQVFVSSATGCSIRSSGTSGKYLNLQIRIDTMGQYIDSPQGRMGGAIPGVAGKEFEMTITPDGKEKDLSGAKAITYNDSSSGKSDAAGSFIDFFPDLPLVPVSAGYTWLTEDTVAIETESSSQIMIVKSQNKIDGVEIKNGSAYITIISSFSGTFDMKAITQGMNILTRGPMEGSSKYVFSVKEGYFLSNTSSTKVLGTIEINMGDIMTFPVSMTIASVNELVK